VGIGCAGLFANSHYLSGPDCVQLFETGLHRGQEVFQQNRPPAENQRRDVPILKALLVFKAAINRYQYVEFRGFRSPQ
jgi:hypothetical protein